MHESGNEERAFARHHAGIKLNRAGTAHENVEPRSINGFKERRRQVARPKAFQKARNLGCSFNDRGGSMHGTRIEMHGKRIRLSA